MALRSIRIRLGLLFGLVGFTLVLAAWYGRDLWSLHQSLLERRAQIEIPVQDSALSAIAQLRKMTATARVEGSPATEAAIAELSRAISVFAGAAQGVGASPHTQHKLLSSVEQLRHLLDPSIPEATQAEEILRRSLAVDEQLGQVEADLQAALDEVFAAERQHRASIDQQIHDRAVVTMGLLVAGLLILAALYFVVVWSIIFPMDTLVDALDAVARGDIDLGRRLKIRGPPEFEAVTSSFNRFVDKLTDVLRHVKTSTTGLRDGGHLTSEFSDLHSQLKRHRTQIETLARATERLHADIQLIHDASISARKDAAQVGAEAQGGSEKVGATTSSMGRVREDVDGLRLTVEGLVKSSEQVGEIVEIIDDIADQTNLLSLNAAIEAARAGERGRGFTVVAEEIRDLSAKTSRSTQEVVKRVKAIQQGTDRAIESVHHSTAQVGVGVQLVAEAGGALKRLEVGIDQVVTSVQSIAKVSADQANEISQMGHLVSEMRDNAAQALESAEASIQRLNNQTRLTQELQSWIDRVMLPEAQ